ncbi:hypothetical protein [Streptomyces californicus]|uniref:hypothetical protein n=1 Tax=Streptomyces californicus TaxID=67351 RepID=UPI003407B08D
MGKNLLQDRSGLAAAFQAQVDPVRERRTVRDSQRVPGVSSRSVLPEVQELMQELGFDGGLVRVLRVGNERPVVVEVGEGPAVWLGGEKRSRPGGALDGPGHNGLVSASSIGLWATREGVGQVRVGRVVTVDALARLGRHSAVP